MSAVSTENDSKLVVSIFDALCAQLTMVIGQNVSYTEPQCDIVTERPVGKGVIHLSFRLGFQSESGERFGCLLVPLPDAIALASLLLMVPLEGVGAQRESQTLDETLKDAMLEIGNFVGGAVSGVLRDAEEWDCEVRTRGCQGVRADVRPALPYQEGSPLVAGRCQAKIGDFPAFEMILMLPVCADAAPDEDAA